MQLLKKFHRLKKHLQELIDNKGGLTMATENVNHPSHYNQHPAGIECIDIIRHYTCDIANAIKYLWRAGLKADYSMADCEKEIEDLNKAIWYIEDYVQHHRPSTYLPVDRSEMEHTIYELTGYSVRQITESYPNTIHMALFCLLHVGLISQGKVLHCTYWRADLIRASYNIQQRIEFIKESFAEND